MTSVDVKVTQVLVPGTIVDIRELRFDLTCLDGNHLRIDNPLETAFDLSKVYLTQSEIELEASPFFGFWTDKQRRMFSEQRGVWVSCTDETIIVTVGCGSKDALVQNMDDDERKNIECSTFFVFPENVTDANVAKVKLVLVCNN